MGSDEHVITDDDGLIAVTGEDSTPRPEASITDQNRGRSYERGRIYRRLHASVPYEHFTFS